MRTNIVLNDELVFEARKYVEVKSKRELIDIVLREFIQSHKKKNLIDLYGKGGIRADYNYKLMRTEKP